MFDELPYLMRVFTDDDFLTNLQLLELIMRFQTHVCLISDQATPNLTPILQENFRPEEVVMLVSDRMKREADAFEKVLSRHNIKASRIHISDAFDTAAIETQMLNFLSENKGRSIALNLTGGTKPMAMAAQSAFSTYECPMFYVRHDVNQVLFLRNRQQFEPFTLTNALNLEDYLSVHEYEVLSGTKDLHTIAPKMTELFDNLIAKTEDFQDSIRSLNFLASKAEENKSLDVEIGRSIKSKRNWSELIELFSAADVLRVENNKIYFTDSQSRAFANGGWLEDYVFSIVKGVKNLQDAALNLTIRNRITAKKQPHTMKVDNEFDVAFLAHNRLYLIECKTRFMMGDSEKSAQEIYRLDALADVGGSNTRAMLISYLPIRREDKDRAKNSNVRIVEAGQLKDLRSIILGWISTK